MSIIKNAIDSIQIGIEDYENADDRRSVSAVRNISAGVLLLYKEKLCQLSPVDSQEILIKQNIRPIQNEEGEIVFEGKGHKTVDVQSIKERFKSLGVTVGLDWNRFDEINKLRNDLEHYYTSHSPDAVREIVAKSFLLIRDFLSEQLRLDPQETLGQDAWSTLLEVSDVYSAEEAACESTIESINWEYDSVRDALEYLRCPSCRSSLIEAPYPEDTYPTINLHCKSCDSCFLFDEVVEQCIDDSLGGEAYYSIKNGGESPYDTCLACEKDTFIYAEGKCVACEYELGYANCERCNAELRLDDQYNGRCGSCQHDYERLMAE